MPHDTLTLRMVGEISLDDYAATMQRFREFLRTLSQELAPQQSIQWTVEDLRPGSAEITVLGQTHDIQDIYVVESVTHAYMTIGKALAERQPVPYSLRVRDRAEALLSVLNGAIHELQFRVEEDEVIISAPSALPPRRRTHALGELHGVIENLQRRGRRGIRRRFILYESLFNRAVECYFTPEQEETLREAWKRKVAVVGRIGRDPIDGHPIDIRDVQEIRILEEPEPFDYTQAFGILDLGEESPEVLIRKLRDAR